MGLPLVSVGGRRDRSPEEVRQHDSVLSLVCQPVDELVGPARSGSKDVVAPDYNALAVTRECAFGHVQREIVDDDERASGFIISRGLDAWKGVERFPVALP